MSSNRSDSTNNHNVSDSPVLFFDEACVLCNGTVKRLIKVDKRGVLRFAPLQGEFAKAQMIERDDFPTNLSTFVLLEGSRVFTRSTAALRVLRYLPFPHNLPRVFWIVPRFIRDAVYDFVARNRTRWFGTTDSCPVYPDPIQARFID